MRRLTASFGLLMLLWLVLAPVLAAAQAPAAHACCRRGGRHHCASSADRQSPAFRAQEQRCPMRCCTSLCRTISASLAAAPISLTAALPAAGLTACSGDVVPPSPSGSSHSSRAPPTYLHI